MQKPPDAIQKMDVSTGSYLSHISSHNNCIESGLRAASVPCCEHLFVFVFIALRNMFLYGGFETIVKYIYICLARLRARSVPEKRHLTIQPHTTAAAHNYLGMRMRMMCTKKTCLRPSKGRSLLQIGFP